MADTLQTLLQMPRYNYKNKEVMESLQHKQFASEQYLSSKSDLALQKDCYNRTYLTSMGINE